MTEWWKRIISCLLSWVEGSKHHSLEVNIWLCNALAWHIIFQVPSLNSGLPLQVPFSWLWKQHEVCNSASLIISDSEGGLGWMLSLLDCSVKWTNIFNVMILVYSTLDEKPSMHVIVFRSIRLTPPRADSSPLFYSLHWPGTWPF